MANDMSNYQADVCLDDALSPPVGALYMSLHSADPGKTGASELGATGSYARIVCTSAFGTQAVDGVIANDAAIAFATATADWNSGSTIPYAGIWDALSGGNFLFRVAITVPKAVLSGQTPSFPIGDVDVTLS